MRLYSYMLCFYQLINATGIKYKQSANAKNCSSGGQEEVVFYLRFLEH